MDGWEFLARIKQDGSPWAEVPVVIVSIVSDARKGYSLGAAQVLQKPVSRAQLAGVLDHLGLRRPNAPSPKVLVVDDDPKAVERLSTCLVDAGSIVLPAHGGQQGIELARRERPDLLILDLLMPEVSGFDVVEALKGDSLTCSIPIIIVTGQDVSETERRLLNGHVTAIVEKSAYSREAFAAEVRRATGGRTGVGSTSL
jgi:CheY-like chemotaxis protein